jgi:hypothetical protein
MRRLAINPSTVPIRFSGTQSGKRASTTAMIAIADVCGGVIGAGETNVESGSVFM